MAESMTLIPVRTSRQGTSLNAGKLKDAYQDETSTIELHRDDMAKLGLKKGDKVRLRSENGSEAIVRCKDRKGTDATPGLIFMAYGPTSSLFMDADTAGSGMPLSKHLAVEIEGPIGDDGALLTPSPTLPDIAATETGALLSVEQSGSFHALLAASISPTQAAWLSGYFAALSGQPNLLQGSTVPTAPGPALAQMTILYGSQTGNGEGLAEDLQEQATARGFNAKAVDMMDFEPASITDEQILFVIVSTHGEGDPPYAAEKLHAYLSGADAPQLDQLKFGVFALGDSGYEFYCKTGRDFDAFLETSGATRIVDRVDADIDFEEPAEAWMEAVLDAYQNIVGEAVSASAKTNKKATKDKSNFSKTNPFHAPVLLNINLSGEGSAKENRHIEIALEDSGLTYLPGDALGVYPLNNPDYVNELLNVLNMDGSEPVTVNKETLLLRDAFIEKLDITALSRINMEKYADLIGSEELKTLLDDTQKEEFNEYTWGRQILDLVEDNPAEGINTQDFVDILRRIPGRLYSIASSLSARPGQVDILVGAVRYHSFDRDREGVCSTFLAGRVAENQKLAIYVQGNKNFRLPDDDNAPVIMVGPGTGMAPFRSFLQERQANGAKGKNWLFFGDQHQASDFVYSEEIQQLLEAGILTKLSLAFSRDQERKIYVQTRIMEDAPELYQWLEEGAYFYICGDAERMAVDVHKALIATVVQEGNKSQDEAEDYINAMLDAGRYQRDVY